MNRRNIVAGTAAGAIGAAALAAPALAQAMPEIRWRCASSFPKSLDTIYGAGEHVAKRVLALTDGKFQIRVFGAGELVPARTRPSPSTPPGPSASTSARSTPGWSMAAGATC
jgi:TRAP-type mannitol/chloroaromatic compound transport system substrate-binding protein